MSSKYKEISSLISERRADIVKVTFSSPVGAEYAKIALRPISLKGALAWQAERFRDNKVFHLNVADAEIAEWVESAAATYAQICVAMAGESVTFSLSGKGIQKSASKNNLQRPTTEGKNNREKNYILREGENIPALVELGVFTKDFRIVSGKHDKYKQINRFIELIDDAYRDYSDGEITILDFGCGKSYLTFIVYYYFVKIKGVKAKIIGYDLKADVVESCNRIAKKYGYDDLTFVVSDVTRDTLYGEKIDMIISLHACDVATDYALFYAIQKNVKSIFSVPCCQHEINSSIKKGGELDVFLKYGIVKERMSALLTDTIRAMILEDMGYSVDMIEFVDLEQSPKNLMLRAKKTKIPSKKNRQRISALMEAYRFNQTLYRLVNGSEDKTI